MTFVITPMDVVGLGLAAALSLVFLALWIEEAIARWRSK